MRSASPPAATTKRAGIAEGSPAGETRGRGAVPGSAQDGEPPTVDQSREWPYRDTAHRQDPAESQLDPIWGSDPPDAVRWHMDMTPDQEPPAAGPDETQARDPGTTPVPASSTTSSSSDHGAVPATPAGRPERATLAPNSPGHGAGHPAGNGAEAEGTGQSAPKAAGGPGEAALGGQQHILAQPGAEDPGAADRPTGPAGEPRDRGPISGMPAGGEGPINAAPTAAGDPGSAVGWFSANADPARLSETLSGRLSAERPVEALSHEQGDDEPAVPQEPRDAFDAHPTAPAPVAGPSAPASPGTEKPAAESPDVRRPGVGGPVGVGGSAGVEGPVGVAGSGEAVGPGGPASSREAIRPGGLANSGSVVGGETAARTRGLVDGGATMHPEQLGAGDPVGLTGTPDAGTARPVPTGEPALRGPELIEAGMVYVDPDPEIGSPPTAAGWDDRSAAPSDSTTSPGGGQREDSMGRPYLGASGYPGQQRVDDSTAMGSGARASSHTVGAESASTAGPSGLEKEIELDAWTEPVLPMGLAAGPAPSDREHGGSRDEDDFDDDLVPIPDPSWPRLFAGGQEVKGGSGEQDTEGTVELGGGSGSYPAPGPDAGLHERGKRSPEHSDSLPEAGRHGSPDGGGYAASHGSELAPNSSAEIERTPGVGAPSGPPNDQPADATERVGTATTAAARENAGGSDAGGDDAGRTEAGGIDLATSDVTTDAAGIDATTIDAARTEEASTDAARIGVAGTSEARVAEPRTGEARADAARIDQAANTAGAPEGAGIQAMGTAIEGVSGQGRGGEHAPSPTGRGLGASPSSPEPQPGDCPGVVDITADPQGVADEPEGRQGSVQAATAGPGKRSSTGEGGARLTERTNISTVARRADVGEVDLRESPASPPSGDVSRETSAGGGGEMDGAHDEGALEDEAALAVRDAVSRAAAEAGVDVSRETDIADSDTALDGLAEAEPSIDSELAARNARVTFRVHRDSPNGTRRVLAVANQKGGVGKSTTAVNIGAYLALAGARVLVVDLDPQGNASTGLGLDHREIEPSIYDVLTGEASPTAAIRPTGVANLHVLPSTIDLAGAEVELVSAMSRETRLRRALESIDHQYDTILIDCPPSLGLLTVNALAAANELLIPIQCEYYALEGLGQLLRNVELVRANLNPELRIGGIVLTMYDGRTRLALQVVDEVRKHFTDVVYQTVVPRSVRLSEAPGYGLPIALYDPLSRGGIAYRDLTFELAERSGLLAPTGEGAS